MSKVVSAFVATVFGLALVGSALAQQSTTGAGTQPGASDSSGASGASTSPSTSSPSGPSSSGSSPATSSPGVSSSGSSGTSSGAGTASAAAPTIDASSIIGATVRANGKDVGKVSKLMVDPGEGRITTVVVGMGGMLGVGQKDVAVPWSSVKVARDGSRIVVDASQLPLEEAPSASPRDSDKSSSDKSKK